MQDAILPPLRDDSLPPTPAPSSSGVAALVVVVVLVAALYFGREVFIPLALAVLLSFALSPLVTFLHRRSVNRVVAVAVVVGLTFMVIGGVGLLVGTQLARLTESLPQYQSNISHKLLSLRDTTKSDGIIGRAVRTLSAVGNQLAGPDVAPETSTAAPGTALESGAARQAPVPVVIRQADPSPLELLVQLMGPVLGPLLTAGIVIVFVIFFMLQRQDLRDRFIRLVGSGDLQRTTHALDDAAHRLSRYLLSQTAVNASLGLLIAAGLWMLGVPNPVMWGILTMLLRFVPFIGILFALALPVALAVAIDPGWTTAVSVVLLFVVVEALTSQVVEPWLYGHNTGLSPVAVIIAAAFWALLWGPVGLLLATPLTMCLVVLGRHVERLEFLEILLGDRPPLAPEESFYQRMLAGDPDEAAHQAEAHLKTQSLAAYYDKVAIKALALAQIDVNRGVLNHTHRTKIRDSVAGVIDDLADHADASAEAVGAPAPGLLARVFASEAASDAPSPGWAGGAVLCVAGRGALDEAAAAMLTQLFGRRGIPARVVPAPEVTVAHLPRLDVADVRVVCLSYLEPGSFANPRFLVRRLRRRLPQALIVDCFWTLSDQEIRERNALAATGADVAVTSLEQAVAEVIKAAARPAVAEAPQAVPQEDMVPSTAA